MGRFLYFELVVFVFACCWTVGCWDHQAMHFFSYGLEQLQMKEVKMVLRWSQIKTVCC